MRPLTWFAFGCVLLVSTAQASERYELSDGTILEGVERFDGSLPKAAFTILGMTLGEHKFADVQKYFGTSAEVMKARDPHEADTICYASAVDQKVRLVFSSGGPEDQTDKLTSFTLTSDGALLKKGHCIKSFKLTKQVGTQNELRLGLSQSEVVSILGTPSKITSNWAIYAYQKYYELSPEERASKPRAPGGGEYKGVYTYHDLQIHFINGKSDQLAVMVGGEVDW
jgi:hypothetical protein